MNEKPVIIVAAYNRVHSLQRLLYSLSRTSCPENTKLVISIDYSDDNIAIVDCANQFEWNAGDKEVIVHPVNLGLKNHILSCGDLTENYGSVIILEDDLYVSPFFFDYTLQALDFYSDDENISGVGLFNYMHLDRVSSEPFSPVADANDVYFIQYACSWGQAWTHEQWVRFREWYDTSPDLSLIPGIPENVLKWPDRSWKKYFIGYVVLYNKYFVLPRVSLTANFDDIGTNRTLSTYQLQSVLLVDQKKFQFCHLKESLAVYDSHFEIMPDIIKRFNKVFDGYDFAVDIYGYKNPDKIKESFLLTTKKSRNILHGYAREMKPHEMNVIFNIPGRDIVLCRKDELIPESGRDKILTYVKKFNYYYRNVFSFKELMRFALFRVYRLLGFFDKFHKVPR